MSEDLIARWRASAQSWCEPGVLCEGEIVGQARRVLALIAALEEWENVVWPSDRPHARERAEAILAEADKP